MASRYGFASGSALLACTLIFAAPASGAKAQDSPQDSPIVLVPHRAIYDLTLGQTRGNAQIVGVRGRILYDFDGNACDGYTLRFRQVSELDSGEGKISTSDLRSTTWEGGDAKSFKFTSENFVDENLVDAVDGRAEHGAKATAVSLIKPEHKVLDIDPAVVFPTEHMVRVILAARAGKSILDFPVFDGSDTGDKVYDTLTVIGHKLSSDDRKHGDAADGDDKACRDPALAGHDQLFRQGPRAKKHRANAGLCDRLRALRERHFARFVARLQRLRCRRQTHLARDQTAKALPLTGAGASHDAQRLSGGSKASPLTTASSPKRARTRSSACSASAARASTKSAGSA